MPHYTRAVLALLTVFSLVVPAGALAAASTTAQVRGVLLDAQGLPATGHQIALRSKGNDLYTSGPTGADGSFVVTELPPDTYRLVAFAPDGTEYPILGREVELKAGQVERLELRLGGPAGAPGRTAAPAGARIGWWAGLGTASKVAIVTGGVFAVGFLVSKAGDDDDEPPVSAGR